MGGSWSAEADPGLSLEISFWIILVGTGSNEKDGLWEVDGLGGGGVEGDLNEVVIFSMISMKKSLKEVAIVVGLAEGRGLGVALMPG